MHLVGWSGAGDEVDFDAEVGARFPEGCVCCFWEDPANVSSCSFRTGVMIPTFLAQ